MVKNNVKTNHEEKIESEFWNVDTLIFVFILIGIWIGSFYNFLLFHSLAEIFSIFIGFAIFIVVLNSKKSVDNYLVFLGVSFLFISFIDLIHTFAYKGMNIFVGFDANLPTQLWIVARYMQAIALLIAPIFITKRINTKLIFSGYFILVSALLTAIFFEAFPAAFIEGSGLTLFKIYSEYIISMILIGAIVFLHSKKDYLDNKVYNLLVASIVFTIIAELLFTFYIEVYGLSNLFGHLFKIIAFYLIYEAIVVTNLSYPFSVADFRVKKLMGILDGLARGDLKVEVDDELKTSSDVVGDLSRSVDKIIMNLRGVEPNGKNGGK